MFAELADEPTMMLDDTIVAPKQPVSIADEQRQPLINNGGFSHSAQPLDDGPLNTDEEEILRNSDKTV